MADSYIPVAVQRLVLTESKGFCEYCWFASAFLTKFIRDRAHSYHFELCVPSDYVLQKRHLNYFRRQFFPATKNDKNI